MLGVSAMKSNEIKHFDYIVIGSGLAGLTCACRLAQSGRTVAVFTKRGIDECNSRSAQGGVACVTDADDTFDELNSSFLSDKTKKQDELNNIENKLNSIKEKELNSKFINEQKEKIIESFKDFKELNYEIVNGFIDYIEIGEKNKEKKLQDVVIHWNF